MPQTVELLQMPICFEFDNNTVQKSIMIDLVCGACSLAVYNVVLKEIRKKGKYFEDDVKYFFIHILKC